MAAENAHSAENLFKVRISEGEVAEILTLISAPPNLRDRPQPKDLVGDFDAWFDGGALKYDTGATTYRFAKGASAVVFVLPKLSVLIKFRNREQLRIIQETIP